MRRRRRRATSSEPTVAPNATIGDLLAGRAPEIGEDVTVFKSVGIASQDVAAAERALRRAEQLGLGWSLD